MSKVVLAGLCVLFSATVARGVIPYADDPDAYTEKKHRQHLLAHNIKSMSEAYMEVGRRDPSWDDLAVELLDGLAVRFTNYKAYGADRIPVSTPGNRMDEIIDRLIELGCDDPMVRYAMLVRSDKPRKDRLALARSVYGELFASDYPNKRKLTIANRFADLLEAEGVDEEAHAVRREQGRVIANILAEPIPDVFDQGHHFKLIHDDLNEIPRALWLELYEKAEASDSPNRWLINMIGGTYHVQAAWDARGSGWASTVTGEGWKGFAEHLKKAAELLTRAWQLNPELPDAAEYMIEVSMGQSTGEERLWFERAIEAQFDYYSAYDNYLWSIRPRWGGSLDELYNFGVECLETGRFDTRVPRVFYKAMQDIAKDEGDYEYFVRPGVYEHLLTYFEGRKNEPNPSDSAQWWDSMKAAIAWRAGRYHDAVYWMKRLGDGFNPKVFTKFEGDRVLAPSECYARIGEFEPEMNRARQHWAAEEYRRSAETFEEALVHMVPGDPARAYFRHLSIWAQRQHQDVKGIWVDLLNQPDLFGWINRAGEWSADEQGRITGVSVKRGMYLESRFNLGYRIEIKGTITFPDKPYKDNYNAGVMLASRLIKSKRYHRDVLLYRDKQEVLAARNFTYDQGVYPAAVEDTNTFLIQMWDEHVRLVLNDVLIYEDRVMPDDLPNTVYPFAIGGWFTDKGVTVCFDELKVRRLRDRPAWVVVEEKKDATIIE